MAIQTLLFLLLSFHLSTAQADVKAAYWFPASEFPVANINSTLFTHLFCAFANLDSNTNKVTISSSDAAAFSSFTSTVQQKNPSVATLLSIGGGSSKSSTFSSMASQSSSRKVFIDSSIQLAQSNGFLGLDLDWEYPQTSSDMTNMGTLFAEWRAAVNSESTSSGKKALLLTAAVSVSSNVNSVTYPISSIGSNLDWINVMAYDYYGPTWKLVTSAHTALNDPSGGASTSAGIQAWTAAGLSSKKLVLGLAYYGYAWKLTNTANHGLGAASTGPATGTGIGSDGSIGYNQIKSFIQSSGATTVYNSTVVINYCYSGSTWIGYDDVQSIQVKVSFAKGKALLGYFAWSVSGDNNWALSQQAFSTWG